MNISAYKAPYLPPDKIRKKAAEFLSTYHITDGIPVPIEKIAEEILGITILPAPLKDAFDIEGLLSSDLHTIWVDDRLYYDDRYEFRYISTIAHEIGHIFLHREFYELFTFHTIREWAYIYNNMDQQEHGWMERHAYTFAGLVTVPPEHLSKEFQKACSELKDEGYDPEKNKSIYYQYVLSRLSRKFLVSTPTLMHRLVADGLMTPPGE